MHGLCHNSSVESAMYIDDPVLPLGLMPVPRFCTSHRFAQLNIGSKHPNQPPPTTTSTNQGRPVHTTLTVPDCPRSCGLWLRVRNHVASRSAVDGHVHIAPAPRLFSIESVVYLRLPVLGSIEIPFGLFSSRNCGVQLDESWSAGHAHWPVMTLQAPAPNL